MNLSYFQRFALLCLLACAAPVVLPAAEARVYAGGVAGAEDLLVPEHSADFRAAGGGLYLHNNGWAKLSADQQVKVLQVFAGASVAVELGFNTEPSSVANWANRCRSAFVNKGIRPVFVAVNAYADNRQPTPEQWDAYTNALRGPGGLPPSTLVLPTFEYQNFQPNKATLARTKLSQTPRFQAIVKAAGGLVVDAPSGYFFKREQAYREWVVDAIRWTRGQHLRSVLIISPHDTGGKFAEETGKYLRFLIGQGILPDVIVCENYSANPPKDYPNRVGDEKSPQTILGVARQVQKAMPGPR